MEYRSLGRTNIMVSEIGYGAWGISKEQWLGAKDSESIRALNVAIDLGLNFIDTALAYGNGHSERIVGEVIKKRSEEIYVSSKVPPKNLQWPAHSGTHVNDVFPKEHIIFSTEQSLRNLGRETIDVQQFHVWNDEWIEQGDWLETVSKLKEQGKIRHFGVSVNDHQPSNIKKLISTGMVDTVQVIYNIFDQSPEDELLPLCQQHNIGVIVRVPLDEGGLTGKIDNNTIFPEGDWRNQYFRGDRKNQVYERNVSIINELKITMNRLPEMALKYILSNQTVSTVIPGMRSVVNVEKNISVSDGIYLSEDKIQKLKNHRWIRNFYM